MATLSAVRSRTLVRPDWLSEDAWPFETTTIAVGAQEIAVTETGQGPTLLFYTGIGSFIWRDVLLRLSTQFHCVTLDPPGIGLSAPTTRSEATLKNSARAVGAVIRERNLNDLSLVAHDSGGPPAFAAVAQTADRVRGIVALNTFGWRPSNVAFRAMLAFMGSDLVRRIDLVTDFLARLTTTSFGVGRHLDDATRRAFRIGLVQGEAAFHDYLRDARDSGVYDDVTEAFAGPFRSLPLLTIFGERNDPFGFQPQWKRLVPETRQVVIPRGNHFPMCDDPDFVANAIRTWHHESTGRSMETQR
jgi:pimeloyl-ACP methyl ester carboxylesterase